MIFENKFLIGFESRIYDGLPIHWNGDENSIVTFFIELYAHGNIETDDTFDIMKRRETASREKQKTPFINIVTLICGKYIKSATGKTGHGNFIINGIDGYKKWHTVYRRCEGILCKLEAYIDMLAESAGKHGAMSKIPQETLTNIFNHYHKKMNFGSSTRIDYTVNHKVFDMIHSVYRTEPQTKAPRRLLNRDRGLFYT
jgi:hypothetical protein